MLGITSEPHADADKFRRETGISFAVLPSNKSSRLFSARADPNISPYPFDVIVDRQGVVRYLSQRLDVDAMVRTVEALVRESTP